MPLSKVITLKEKIQQVLVKKITLVEVQSSVGALNFVCKAVASGIRRAFLRRLISLTQRLTKPHHRVRLSLVAKRDLAMWLEFIII